MYAGYLPFLFRKENFNYFFVVDFSLVFLVGITKHKPRESVKSRRKKISPASSIQDSKNIIIVFENHPKNQHFNHAYIFGQFWRKI